MEQRVGIWTENQQAELAKLVKKSGFWGRLLKQMAIGMVNIAFEKPKQKLSQDKQVLLYGIVDDFMLMFGIEK